MTIKVKKINNKATLPTRMTKTSVGYDLYACIDEKIPIQSEGGIALIPTGISIQLPEGHEAQIRPRSGLALKYKITVLNSPATIDTDYIGEIKVLLINHSKDNVFVVEPNMRIAQLVISKYEQPDFEMVEEFNKTGRGENGFGSTGI